MSEESACWSFGVEADDDGNTITNGKVASCTTAEGKEPPDGDMKTVTKNSLLKTARKTKLHDCKSDHMRTIGTDDGEEEIASDSSA